MADHPNFEKAAAFLGAHGYEWDHEESVGHVFARNAGDDWVHVTKTGKIRTPKHLPDHHQAHFLARSHNASIEPITGAHGKKGGHAGKGRSY
jgi:hypothetical protein